MYQVLRQANGSLQPAAFKARLRSSFSTTRIPIFSNSTASSIMTTHNSFDYFPLLPAELRVIIWELCLPRRIVDFNMPTERWSTPLLDDAIFLNSRPPLTTRVCRESREIAFKNGFIWKRFGRSPSGMVQPKFTKGSYGIGNLWITRATDSVLVNVGGPDFTWGFKIIEELMPAYRFLRWAEAVCIPYSLLLAHHPGAAECLPSQLRKGGHSDATFG